MVITKALAAFAVLAATLAPSTGRDRAGAQQFEPPAAPNSKIEERRAAEQRAGSPCVPGPTTLCLNGSRFKVEAVWRVPAQERSGVANAVGLTGDTGYFWFFSSNNIELMLKVVDGRAVNLQFWVFYGALSDVEYTVTVTDTVSGAVKTYFNPSGRLASVADTGAFYGGPFSVTEASNYVRASSGVSEPIISEAGSITEMPASVREPACTAGPMTLCLNGGRFRVESSWLAAQTSTTGPAAAVSLTSDTGAFWFFSSNNIELVVKVVDGRAVNGAFWVFFGALSNIQYEITVTDTQTGAVRTYWNGRGNVASVADTSAFDPSVARSVWRKLAPGPLGNAVSSLAVDLSHDDLYCASGPGIFRLSVGRSDSWIQTSVNPGVGTTITLAPTDPPTLYTPGFGDASPLRGIRYQVLFRSIDAGKTWAATLNNAQEVAVDPIRPATAYAGVSPDYVWYDVGVHKSTNNGAQWAGSTGGFSCGAVAVSPSDPEVVYATGGSIFKSLNAGATWSELPGGDYLYGMIVPDPESSSSVFVLSSRRNAFPTVSGVSKTKDGGATWSFSPFSFTRTGPMVFERTSRTLFIASDSGVVRSDDEGETWKPFSDGLTGFDVLSLVIGPNRTLYAGTRDGVYALTLP